MGFDIGYVDMTHFMPHPVISNAVRNLVLYRVVAFSLRSMLTNERCYLGVRDEISHCVRNDRVGLG